MINKRSRKTSTPVEQMKQHGFNAAKGIDTTASADSTGHVLMLKNLEIEPDGSLKLRKPLIPRFTLPEVVVDERELPTEVICSKYMYDNKHMFIVRKAEDGTQYVGIFEGLEPKSFQLTIQSWYDYTEHILYPYPEQSSGYISLPYLDFTNVDLKNAANSTIITGVLVNIRHSSFKITSYTDLEDATELYYPTLYELTDYTLWQPRTLNITSPEYISNDFDCKIFTPSVTELEPSEDVPLDINLDADNPYAIRDVYDSSLPTLKNVVAYVPTVDRGSKIQILDSFDSIPTSNFTENKDIYTPNECRIRPFEYDKDVDVGEDLDPDPGVTISSVRLKYLTYAEIIDVPEDPEGIYLKISYTHSQFPNETDTPNNYFIHKSACNFSFLDDDWTVKPQMVCFTYNSRVNVRNLKTGESYSYQMGTNFEALGTPVREEYTPDGYLKYTIWKMDLGTYVPSPSIGMLHGYTITSADWASVLKGSYLRDITGTKLFRKTYYINTIPFEAYLSPSSMGFTRFVGVAYTSRSVYGVLVNQDNRRRDFVFELYDNGAVDARNSNWYRFLTIS